MSKRNRHVQERNRHRKWSMDNNAKSPSLSRKLPRWGLVVEAEGDTGDRARFATEAEAIEWAEEIIRGGDWTNDDGKLDGRTITCTYWLTRDGERLPRTYTVDIEG